MYVEVVKRSSKWSYTSLPMTFLIFNQFSIHKKFGKLRQMLSMSKVSKVGSIYPIRGCNAMYVEVVKRSLKWSYTSLLITFLIFNGFSIHKKFGKLRQMLSMSKVSKVAQYTL